MSGLMDRLGQGRPGSSHRTSRKDPQCSGDLTLDPDGMSTDVGSSVLSSPRVLEAESEKEDSSQFFDCDEIPDDSTSSDTCRGTTDAGRRVVELNVEIPALAAVGALPALPRRPQVVSSLGVEDYMSCTNAELRERLRSIGGTVPKRLPFLGGASARQQEKRGSMSGLPCSRLCAHCQGYSRWPRAHSRSLHSRSLLPRWQHAAWASPRHLAPSGFHWASQQRIFRRRLQMCPKCCSRSWSPR